ncbi:MAG: hypothetical protein AAF713_01700 [Pseudomonadota bacterium]
MRIVLYAHTAPVFVAACSVAELNTIDTRFNPTHGDSSFVDAKQRAVYSLTRPS